MRLLLARTAPARQQQRGLAAVDKLCARRSNLSAMASSSSSAQGGPPSPVACIDFLMLLQNLKVGARAAALDVRRKQGASTAPSFSSTLSAGSPPLALSPLTAVVAAAVVVVVAGRRQNAPRSSPSAQAGCAATSHSPRASPVRF
jgi:hypothetical protein